MHLHDTLGFLAGALMPVIRRQARGAGRGLPASLHVDRLSVPSAGAQRQPAVVSARAINSASSWWP
ncbi:MAG: hypothetical protein IH627_10865 [Rubrivivax sp.]|nr:hypothetical protein [Rubrivivax sp.]